tara:strand:+ start:308 stop:2317 length:2010 start_codon:yes stop_codon:yes gene_type:complete
MQKVEIYIEGQRVELFKDESISLTQTIQNAREIGKIFTDFSKTFNLPASKVNNKIFKHYYNFDITNGFDARKKVNANIELNSAPFRDGKIKLEGVDLRNNLPYSYKVTFFGNIVSLKDIFAEDTLQGLDLSAHDTLYGSTEVIAAMQSDPTTNDVIAPLITHSQLLYFDSTNSLTATKGNGNLNYTVGVNQGVNWDDIKYAIRLDTILRAIESKYNLTFSSDFFTSSNTHFYNLFMWLHRKSGAVEKISEDNQAIVYFYSGLPTDPFDATETKVVASGAVRVIGEPSGYTTYSVSCFTASTKSYKVVIIKDGVEVFKSESFIGNSSVTQVDFTLEQGDYSVGIEGSFNITFTDVKWDIEYNTGTSVETIAYSTGTYIFTSVFNFIISQQIPTMGVLDFLTGLFKTFNLTAYFENNIIVVKTLDAYYSGGISYDISKYVDTSKGAVNIALPFKEISFKHGDTKTFQAAKHGQKFGKTWGESEYDAGETLDGGKYDVTTPFSQMKYERLKDEGTNTPKSIQVGWSVSESQSSHKGKPLIFYPIFKNTDTIALLLSSTNPTTLTSYNVPSNSLSLTRAGGLDNINFFNELNEWTGTQDWTDTLFEKYYKNYITSIFDSRNRLTKITAYLPLRILLNYNLSDRFTMNGNSYKINSITTNLNSGKSDIELLNDL